MFLESLSYLRQKGAAGMDMVFSPGGFAVFPPCLKHVVLLLGCVVVTLFFCRFVWHPCVAVSTALPGKKEKIQSSQGEILQFEGWAKSSLSQVWQWAAAAAAFTSFGCVLSGVATWW